MNDPHWSNVWEWIVNKDTSTSIERNWNACRLVMQIAEDKCTVDKCCKSVSIGLHYIFFDLIACLYHQVKDMHTWPMSTSIIYQDKRTWQPMP